MRVEFAGFSGSDVNMRRGTHLFQKKAPPTPGYCLVGRVEANGAGCATLRPGDRVACLSIYGAEAERVDLPEKYLVAVPDGLESAAATALVLDWNTAYGLVAHAARVRAGQKVFVHGMSAAVGYAAMTLTKVQGAEVFGTASAKNHDVLIAAGATPFAYLGKGWIAAMRAAGGVDAVFDALRFQSYDESYSILRRGGTLAGYGINLPAMTGAARPRAAVPEMLRLLSKNLADFSGRKTTFYHISRKSETFRADLSALFDLLAAGTIAAPIKAVYPLEDVRAADRDWGKGAGVGSVVIRVQR